MFQYFKVIVFIISLATIASCASANANHHVCPAYSSAQSQAVQPI